VAVESIVDHCVLAMARHVSCGNGRVDYGELCEGASDFCDADACFVKGGECCVAFPACFQFSGPIEFCFFAGGIAIEPGFCTAAGCAPDVAIPATPLCCQQPAVTCSGGSVDGAEEMRNFAGLCASSGGWVVAGTCGADGRCVAAPE
jgi:hypothetical protein